MNTAVAWIGIVTAAFNRKIDIRIPVQSFYRCRHFFDGFGEDDAGGSQLSEGGGPILLRLGKVLEA